jgi:hypothetical protein
MTILMNRLHDLKYKYLEEDELEYLSLKSSTDRTTEFRFTTGAGRALHSSTSRSVPGPSEPPVERISLVKRSDVKLVTHLRLEPWEKGVELYFYLHFAIRSHEVSNNFMFIP